MSYSRVDMSFEEVERECSLTRDDIPAPAPNSRNTRRGSRIPLRREPMETDAAHVTEIAFSDDQVAVGIGIHGADA